MSGLELNKIIASILLASLIGMIVGLVANILYKPKLEVAKRGYEIAVTEDAPASDGAAKEVPINIEELMASANAAAAEKTIKKCEVCHSFEKDGPSKIGPNLWAIVGAEKAKKEGFSYSKALVDIGGVWDNDSLFHFLKKPSKFVPGTKMSFPGINDPKEIANVIAYLKEKAD